MRISGIEKFIGGADNVVALSILQGEQRRMRGFLRNPDGTPILMQGFHLDVETEFYLANVVTNRRSSIVSDLQPVPTPLPGDEDKLGEVSIEVEDAAHGAIALTFPTDLYQLPITPDETTDVPMVVVYVRYSDGYPGHPQTLSRVNRFVLFVRRTQFTSPDMDIN